MAIYEPLNQALQQVGALLTAAEAHGLLCGFLCAPPSPNHQDNSWLPYILGETTLKEELTVDCQQQLQLLKNYTQSQLNSPDCEFMLLLPAEDLPLAERVQAIGGWCESFLFGLGLAVTNHRPFPTQVKEFLTDVTAISRIAPLTEDSEEEEQEAHFMQLVEYLRIGVLNLHDELTTLDTFTEAKYHEQDWISTPSDSINGNHR